MRSLRAPPPLPRVLAGLILAAGAPFLSGCCFPGPAWALRRPDLARRPRVAVRPANEPAAEVSVRKDVTYFEGPAEEAKRHQLDLYLPEGKKEFPLILFIHGGAWRMGSKDIYGYLGNAFASRGIGVAVANYRLSPGVKHPEHERDVARAFAWLARHAKELGGDEKRLYVAGHSAGGHLVALLALDPGYLKAEGLSTDRIRGVIGISGPYNLRPRMFPDVFGEDPDKRADAFPLNHVTGDKQPPFLILYGDKDLPGLALTAKSLNEAMEKKGGKATVKEIADRDHITIVSKIGQPDDPTTKLIIDFVGP
jgi:arylformamidase